jgi:2-keto-4-pentenoate hydratase/2-oxohepta-3-ene-1,7-dioic acid hydratase in catechol pathway
VSSAPSRPDEKIEIVEIDTNATTTGQLITAIESGLALSESGQRKTILAQALLSPVTTDATLVCQGLNYPTHVQETGGLKRKKNLIFSKASSSLCGAYADIVRPKNVELLDYEAEVGIVLRRDLKSGDVITNDNIGSYVAAVVLCNDISARDAMFGAVLIQWYEGKSYRTFCPAGPVLYWLKPDDVSATLEKLEFTLSYKDTLRQSADTSQMIYKPAETLTELANILDLKAGDMVLTGTSGGVLIGHGSPGRIAEIVRTHMGDDEKRLDEFRKELKSKTSFLEPGETLSLTLRDAHGNRDLGGQFSRIAQG